MPAPILLDSASPESDRSLTPTRTHTLQLECAGSVLHAFYLREVRNVQHLWMTDQEHPQKTSRPKPCAVHPTISCEATLRKQAVKETGVWVFSKHPYKAGTFERNLD